MFKTSLSKDVMLKNLPQNRSPYNVFLVHNKCFFQYSILIKFNWKPCDINTFKTCNISITLKHEKLNISYISCGSC